MSAFDPCSLLPHLVGQDLVIDVVVYFLNNVQLGEVVSYCCSLFNTFD